MAVEALDQVVTLKLSKTQVRRLKEEAERRGLRFGVWARSVLLAELPDAPGLAFTRPRRARGAGLAAPVLPK